MDPSGPRTIDEPAPSLSPVIGQHVASASGETWLARFAVRIALVLTLMLLGIGLWQLPAAAPYYHESQALAVLQQYGCEINRAPPTESPGFAWQLARWQGCEWVFDRVTELQFRIPRDRRQRELGKITDREIEALGQLKSLRTLDMGGTGVTDAQLRQIGPRPNLRVLSLGETNITDASGLAIRQQFPHLFRLDITGTATTGAILSDISQLARLNELNTRDTAITLQQIDYHLGARICFQNYLNRRKEPAIVKSPLGNYFYHHCEDAGIRTRWGESPVIPAELRRR